MCVAMCVPPRPRAGSASIGFQTRLGKQALSDGALDRSEPNDSMSVVPQQKLHPAVAEQALRIKDNDHTGAFSLRVK